MGTEAEREHIRQAFSTARSPEQLNNAVKTYKELMMGKLKPLEDRYNQTGAHDFWSAQINDERIKRDYDAHQAKKNVNQGNLPSGTTSSGLKWKVVQ